MGTGSLENVIAAGANLDPNELRSQLEDSVYSPDDLQKKL